MKRKKAIIDTGGAMSMATAKKKPALKRKGG
jgi:hypothetical protein